MKKALLMLLVFGAISGQVKGQQKENREPISIKHLIREIPELDMFTVQRRIEPFHNLSIEPFHNLSMALEDYNADTFIKLWNETWLSWVSDRASLSFLIRQQLKREFSELVKKFNYSETSYSDLLGVSGEISANKFVSESEVVKLFNLGLLKMTWGNLAFKNHKIGKNTLKNLLPKKYYDRLLNNLCRIDGVLNKGKLHPDLPCGSVRLCGASRRLKRKIILSRLVSF